MHFQDENTIEEGECPGCGLVKTLYFGPDPYQSEINKDETPIWQCEDCGQESKWEI